MSQSLNLSLWRLRRRYGSFPRARVRRTGDAIVFRSGLDNSMRRVQSSVSRLECSPGVGVVEHTAPWLVVVSLRRSVIRFRRGSRGKRAKISSALTLKRSEGLRPARHLRAHGLPFIAARGRRIVLVTTY